VARLLFVLIIMVLMLIGVILFRGSTESYRYLPMDVEKPPKGGPYEEWQEFKSAIGGFRVMLPVVPQHASERLPVSNTDLALLYEMYVSEQGNGTTFMVSMITYPEGLDTSHPDDMLQKVMKEMVGANPDNKLKEMAFVDVAGDRALDFYITSPEVVINSRALWVDGRRTLYLLTIIDKADRYSEEPFQHFLNSFTLEEKVAPPADTTPTPTPPLHSGSAFGVGPFSRHAASCLRAS